MRTPKSLRMHGVLTLGLLLIHLTGQPASALVTEVVVDNGWPDPIAAGILVGLTTVSDAHDAIQSYKWEVKTDSAGGCPSGWTEFGNGAESTFISDFRVGTVYIKLTVTYAAPPPDDPPPPPPHAPTILEYQFEYVPAVSTENLRYDGSNFNFFAGPIMYADIVDPVGERCPGEPYGICEKINVTIPANVPPPFRGGWSDNQSPDPLLHANALVLNGGGTIMDVKTQNVNVGDIGDVIYQYTQEIGIRYLDFCNVIRGPVTLLTVTVKHIKTSDTTWQLDVSMQ